MLSWKLLEDHIQKSDMTLFTFLKDHYWCLGRTWTGMGQEDRETNEEARAVIKVEDTCGLD